MQTDNPSHPPWHLRSLRRQALVNEDEESEKQNYGASSLAPNTAQDLFCKRNDHTKVRTGMIDGQKIVFELQQGVNSKPTTGRKARLRRTRNDIIINAQPSSFEVRSRWWLFRFNLTTVTIWYVGAFLSINFLFAALWSIQDGTCCDDNSLTYTQIFDFSIQTSTTIGYGGYIPKGYFSNFLVVMISFMVLIYNSVYSGLLFVKFSRPTAKIDFSDVITLSNVNGLPCLELRIGNADGSRNLLKDAHVRLSYSFLVDYTDETHNKQTLGQSQELKLLSNRMTQMGEIVWTIRHLVDENSPLFGIDFREYPGNSIYHFEVCLNAMQELTDAPIFCATEYAVEDIMIGHRFEDQMSWNDDRTAVTVDYSKMNSTVPHPVWYPTK